MSYCKKCGTDNPDGSKFCNLCGSPLPGPSSAVRRTSYKGSGNKGTGKYNLSVDYMTINPMVYMSISFVDWQNVVTIMNNETKLFDLQPGLHAAIIQIGNKAYRRNITILGNSPVRIHCAWDGRARINIEQPRY